MLFPIVHEYIWPFSVSIKTQLKLIELQCPVYQVRDSYDQQGGSIM